MGDPVNAKMKEHWNGAGAKKFLQYQHELNASFKPFSKALLEAIAPSSANKVIDIGCGCGDTSFEIARRVGPGGHVLGIDISEPMLERAKERINSSEKMNIRFECVDAQTHGFETETFDIACSRFGVMFFDDPEKAFGNIRSSLKPGGRLVFICWRTGEENDWVQLSFEVAAKHLQLPKMPGPDEPGPHSLSDPEKVKGILKSAGFIDISIRQFDAEVKIGKDLDEAVQFLTHIGPAAKIISESNAGELVKSQLASELREKLVDYDTGQGIFMKPATWLVRARNS